MAHQQIEPPAPSVAPSLLSLLKVPDVATLLGVSEKTVNKLVREKKLACVQVTSRDRRIIREPRSQGCRHWQRIDSEYRRHE